MSSTVSYIVQILMLLYCLLLLVDLFHNYIFRHCHHCTTVQKTYLSVDLPAMHPCVTPEQALNLAEKSKQENRQNGINTELAELQPPYSSTKCQCQILLTHHRINKESMLSIFKFYSNATRLPPFLWQLKLKIFLSSV